MGGGSGVGSCDCRVDRVGRVQTVPIFRVLQCDDEACIPLRGSWYLEPPRARRSWLRGACDRQGSGGRWPSPPFVGNLRMRRVPLPVGITPVHRSSWALYSSHGWTQQRIRIAFVLLDVCWCWKVVLHARPSPAWGLQRPSCFEHADYDQDVSK